ncbi:polyphosphate kinase 1 [Helicobacter mehlei]|uniref:Polyphosphate kinase n=1 Tax=Helicobacter mehlei TaxID=2316080 RepID=A0A553V0N2_9HELI|nr:polyphosphate kinase 1 [Helicobacter mehlei]TSA86026.1 polyphosphate kinase 1 [Helicobacter mehlei]
MELPPDLYFNRELSWLRFNTRVLDQVCDGGLPLLERLKFLAIYGTNLDEFYMIRVAGLKHLYDHSVVQEGLQMGHGKQLECIRSYLVAEQKIVQEQFLQLKEKLAQQHLAIQSVEELSTKNTEKLRAYFDNYLYPVVVPIILDPARPFPFLSNLSFGLILGLQHLNYAHKAYGIIKIPALLKRFIPVEKGVFVPVEQVVKQFAPLLFEKHSVLESMVFRVTCDADMEIIEDEGHDLAELISEGLRTRDRGDVVRLEVSEGNADLLEFIEHKMFGVTKDIYKSDILLNLGSLWELVNLRGYDALKSPTFYPKILAPLNGMDLLTDNAAIFELLDKQDVFLFHPYESFDPIVHFIENASRDKDVVAIRMTLYRVGKQSPIVKALTEAAHTKQISVLVELKARFDEENNLHWAQALENAGAHVIYGVPRLKVHAKLAIVVRQVGAQLKEYVHLSTGNYNTASAKVYTDLSLLTSNKQIAYDILKLFHSLSTGVAAEIGLKTLYMAPMQIKPKIMAMIAEEMRFKQRGRIIFKANALVDPTIIKCLYEASCAGVKIDLIIRGICCLRPQIKGLSENIRVFSIVGKYLEHARIYYFAHDRAKVYFSSADMMPRNLEKRVELLVPATSKAIQQKLMRILHIQLKDNVKAYELNPDGSYSKMPSVGESFNAQAFYEQEVEEHV